jgi:hypothetical protein
MPTWVVVLIVVMFLTVDAIIVTFVFRSIGQTVCDFARQYPPRPPLPGSVRREFQSFGFDMISLGYSLHVEVDEGAMHLSPTLFARWIKIPPCSIPWEAMSPIKTGKCMSKVRIGTVTVAGPTWALKMAGSPEPVTPGSR